MKLTERKIEKLATEYGRKDRLVFDDAQRGLAVRVTAGGGRSYLCQYTLHGRKWRVPLGACSALALSKAREAAAAVMGEVAKGKNPAAERKEAMAAERARQHSDAGACYVIWRIKPSAGIGSLPNVRTPHRTSPSVQAEHHGVPSAISD